MNILIVKISALGDVVHALPAVAYLKNVSPESSIHWLVDEGFAPILEPLPFIDKVLPLNLRKLRKERNSGEFRKLWETIRFIRRAGYDCVIDLQGNMKSGFFTLLSGAGKRFGFDRKGVREWPNLLVTNHKVALAPEDYHISDRSLAIARSVFPAGNIPFPESRLKPPVESEKRVENWVLENNPKDKKIVVCHLGTTWETKLWPLDSWTELLHWLTDRNDVLPLLTWGNEKEKKIAEQVRSEICAPVLLWSGGSLCDLTALLARAVLVIGSDTGPVHMAAVLGTPTVSFYRATDARRNGPRGPKHICLQAPLDCSPCLEKTCVKDVECGHSITLAEAQQAVEKVLSL